MISVIIPTAGHRSTLGGALASIVEQTYDGHIEVIVVNDGGPPLENLERDWARLLDLKLVELPAQRGPSIARNVGIQVSRLPFVAFLDDDDLFLKEHLEVSIETLHDTGADLVYGGALVSEKRYPSSADYIHFGSVMKAYDFDPRFLKVANYIHTGSVVARSLRLATARFDPALRQCEDWDMWLSLLISERWNFAYSGKITSIYHQVPDEPGLVLTGQSTYPTPFAAAREVIEGRWHDEDPIVGIFRAWMSKVEERRNSHISSGHPVPNLFFDSVLHYVCTCLRAGIGPTDPTIDSLLMNGATDAAI